MKKLTLSIIIMTHFSLMSCSVNSMQNQNKSDYEKSKEVTFLKNKFGTPLLLKSIICINNFENKTLFHDKYTDENIDYLEFDKRISSILTTKPFITDSLIYVISNSGKSHEIIKRINNWCNDFLTLDLLWNSDNTILWEKIIFEIPETSDLVTGNFTLPEQSWSSLTSSQLYELPYKVCNLLSAKTDTERIYFYELFYRKARHELNQ